MTTLKISVLGPFQVSADENLLDKFESNKARALLAFLAVEANNPHTREKLAELLWNESLSVSVLGNLRYALAELRKVIRDGMTTPPYLIINRESLQFNPLSDLFLDVKEFERLLQNKTIEACEQAARLYRGDFLAGFPSIRSVPFEEWILIKRERFRRQILETLQRTTRYHEEKGEYEAALSYARQQVEIEPWYEEAHQQLMRILAYTGQRSAALDQFKICRRMLAMELDVAPSLQTLQLFEAIRDGGLVFPQSVSPDGEKTLHPLLVARQVEDEYLDGIGKGINASIEAARSAIRHCANEEAVAHYRHALELFSSLPDFPSRPEQELKLQSALGAALLPVRNFSNPEVVQAFQKAYEICQRIGNRPELFHVLKGLSSYYALCGEIYISLNLSQRLMEIAEEQKDDTLLVIAHNNRGVALLFAGEMSAYQYHAQRLLEIYDENRHHQLALEMGYDPRVAILSHGIGLWMLGFPDQALRSVLQAVAWAEYIQHPFSQCAANFFLAHIHLLRRESQSALENAEKLIEFSQELHNSFWYAQGLLVKGWAIAHHGRSQEGLQLLLHGFSMIHRTGSLFVLRASATWLGEVSGMAGKAGEGLLALEEYIAQSEQCGVLHTLSEQYRVRGELLVGLGRVQEAAISFEKAIQIARQQQAKGWELRALLSLASLRCRQDLAETMIQPLREVSEWFKEGLDTLDLAEARAFLKRFS